MYKYQSELHTLQASEWRLLWLESGESLITSIVASSMGGLDIDMISKSAYQ